MTPARSWFRLLFLVCAPSLVGACHSGPVKRDGGLHGVAENPIPPTDLVEWNGTGFDGARSNALVSGRPVLLFELLGHVGQEEPGTRASLARSELFSNPEVARAMNAGFECAWRSVGPVARLRLDFAGGAPLQRVLGGEVITWVCTPDGGVVDVLPGVMDAETYMEGLHEAALFFESVVEGEPSAKGSLHDAMAKTFGDRLNADDSYWMGFVYQQWFRDSRTLWGRETPLAEKFRRLTPFPFDSRVEVEHVFSVEISAHETDPTYIEIGHVKPGHFEDPLQESTWVAMNQWRPQVLALMGLEPGAPVDVLSPATFRLVFHLDLQRSLSGRIDGFLPTWAQAD